MKKNFKNIAGLLFVGFSIVACSPEEFSGADQNGIPTIDGVNFTVNVDQTTNTVSAIVPEMKGQYPLWYLPAVRTAATDNPKETDFYSTLDSVSRIYALYGDKTVSLRIGNKNGFSQSVITKTVHVNNSLKDLASIKAFLASAGGKMWHIADAEAAHLGYGNTGTDGTGAWTAKADELADLCLYDDSITFSNNGNYTYSPGADGKVLRGGITADKEQAAQPQTATWAVSVKGDDVLLTLSNNTLFPFVADDAQYAKPVFRVENISKNILTLVYDNGKTAWHIILTSIPFGSDKDNVGFQGFDPNSSFNMFTTCKYTNTFYYATTDSWTQLPDPVLTVDGNKFKLVYPTASIYQWQNQFTFKTDMAISATKTYDFSAKITATNDIPAATVKVCSDDDKTSLIDYEKSVSLKANKQYVVYASGVAGKDINNLKMVFDFGGNPANTNVTVSDIVLKDNANDDGRVAPFNYDDPNNMWKDVDANQAYDISFWWSNANWGQIGNPDFKVSTKAYGGKVYTIKANDATVSEWQAQNTFTTKSLPIAAVDSVDFSCVLSCTSAVPRATIKLCEAGAKDDSNELFYKGNVSLNAGEKKVLKFTNVKLKNGTDVKNVKLIFDFGGCKAGDEFTITDITLIKNSPK